MYVHKEIKIDKHPPEFRHEQKVSGMSPHELKLKSGNGSCVNGGGGGVQLCGHPERQSARGCKVGRKRIF
jgi:hypothetical protein